MGVSWESVILLSENIKKPTATFAVDFRLASNGYNLDSTGFIGAGARVLLIDSIIFLDLQIF